MTHSTERTCVGKAEIRDGRRYIEKLCKHWAHKFDVHVDEDGAQVVFPKEVDDPDYPEDAIARFVSTESHLECRLTAFTSAQSEALCGAIDDHLDRFAARVGGLRLAWEPA